MTPRPNLEPLVYALVILLSLAVLLLVACSPSDYLDALVVYQAF